MKVAFGLIIILAVIGCMICLGRIYGIERKKSFIAAICLLATGMLGMFIMFFIEEGEFGGGSFFGAVFLVPLCMYPLAKALGIGYGDLMDICAPAGCLTLAILKFKCYMDGCCFGRLYMTNAWAFRFPSQIVECVVALVLAAVMILIVVKDKHRTMVYPILLVTYGIIRFGLNLLREVPAWLGPLPSGNVWSLLCIIIGCIVLIVNKKKKEEAAA